MAIQSSGRRRFVKLASGEERNIHTGSTDGTQMVVLDGVSDGDRVVASAPPPAAQNQQRMQGSMPGMGMGGGTRRGR